MRRESWPRTTDDPILWQEYRVLRNDVNRSVNNDKKNHYDNIYKRHYDNNDVGALYKTAKTQVGWTKNTSPTNFIIDGRKITDPQSMADIQMKTFAEKTEKLLEELPPPTIDPCSLLVKSLDSWGPKKDARELFDFHTITNLDTLKILKYLSNNTSSANDRLDALALKHGAEILYGPITHVINCSIKTAKFASKWKIGKLLPLHKGKGLNPQDPKSYRPISLLPVLGKIVERVLQPQILNFMESSGQFNTNHHSYRKHHSTVTAMLQLSDAIFTGCDAKRITTLVTLDQSAAFDVLRHTTLKQKLSLYNFSDNVIRWIDSYLSYRSQYVNIGTRDSKYTNIRTGVPQGSVLGPILYVLYVNELPSIMNDENCKDEVHVMKDNDDLFTENCNNCGQMPTYADDSTLVITTMNRFTAQEKIVLLVDKIKVFLASNSLSLNLGKTEIVETMVRQKRAKLAGFPPQLTVVKPDGTLKVILAKDLCRLLGVNINHDATWRHLLDLGEKPLVKGLRSVLGALTHISHHLPIKSRLMLANGLFISKLLYLLPMWGGLPHRDAKTLQILMNKCARMVLGCGRKIRTRTLMLGCNWLYLRELVTFHSAVTMFKIVNIGTPVNIRNKLTVSPDKRVCTTVARLKIVKSSFRWRSVEIWNDLPQHIINIDKLSTFKKTLRKFIIDGRAVVRPRRPPDLD